MTLIAVAFAVAFTLCPVASIKVTADPDDIIEVKRFLDGSEKHGAFVENPTYGNGPALITGVHLKQMDQRAPHMREELRQALREQKKILGHAPMVYFYGDSTMRNQWMTYCTLLDAAAHIPQKRQVADFGKGKKKKIYAENVCYSNDGLGVAALVYTWNTWKGAFPTWGKTKGLPDADLIVYETGHHLLQQVNKPWPLANVHTFSSYEDDYIAFQKQVTSLAPHAQQVLQTTGTICEDHFFGDWRLAFEDPWKASRPCVAMLGSVKGFQPELANSVCQDSLFARNGAMKLNKRLLAAYEKNGRASALADMFKLGDSHCDLTEDGVHFNSMQYDYLDETLKAAGWKGNQKQTKKR